MLTHVGDFSTLLLYLSMGYSVCLRVRMGLEFPIFSYKPNRQPYVMSFGSLFCVFQYFQKSVSQWHSIIFTKTEKMSTVV